MSKLTLIEVLRDLNLLDDDWTICAKWPWTPRSEACIARTRRDVGAAEARDLQSLMDVGLARDLVDGMEPGTWVNTVIDHADRSAFFNAPPPSPKPFGKLSLVRVS